MKNHFLHWLNANKKTSLLQEIILSMWISDKMIGQT